MEHAKVKLILGIGISGCHQERIIDIDWLTKEEWVAMSFDERNEELQDNIEMFMWNYIDLGWEEM